MDQELEGEKIVEQASEEALASPYPRPLNMQLDASYTRSPYRKRLILLILGIMSVYGLVAYVLLAHVPRPLGSVTLQIISYALVATSYLRKTPLFGEVKRLPEDHPEVLALSESMTKIVQAPYKVLVTTQGTGDFYIRPSGSDDQIIFSHGTFRQLTPAQRLAFAIDQQPRKLDMGEIAGTGIPSLLLSLLLPIPWEWRWIPMLPFCWFLWHSHRNAVRRIKSQLAEHGLTQDLEDAKAICRELKRLSRHVRKTAKNSE
jgi:hypothetical protein